MDVILRRAARVLPVDHAGRLLLLRGVDPARPHHRFWTTPGGGVEPGETLVEGAADRAAMDPAAMDRAATDRAATDRRVRC